MPLMKSKSKKAFEHNIKAEMHAGKPQGQSLAIAYNVKKKAPKKYAKGGQIPPSAKTESRPMPDEAGQSEVSRNSGNKPSKQDSWTSRPDIAQSTKGKKTTAIKHPRMVPINGASLRLRDEEDDLQSSAGVNDGPQEQPPKADDEMDAKKSGDSVPDMQREHSNGRKPYAKGGNVHDHPNQYERGVHKPYQIKGMEGSSSMGQNKFDPNKQKSESRSTLEELRSMPKPKFAAGGKVIDEDAMDLRLRDAESDLMIHDDPSGDEGDADAHSLDEVDGNRKGPAVSDIEHEHSNGRKPYAEGGEAREEDDTVGKRDGLFTFPKEDDGHDEMEMDHHDSIASAIMANRDRMHAEIDSGAHDLDEAVRMAEGGEVEDSQADIMENGEEQPNGYYPRNEDEVLKENYMDDMGDVSQLDDSNETGDEREDSRSDKHDMVEKIRRSMKSKRQFKD